MNIRNSNWYEAIGNRVRHKKSNQSKLYIQLKSFMIGTDVDLKGRQFQSIGISRCLGNMLGEEWHTIEWVHVTWPKKCPEATSAQRIVRYLGLRAGLESYERRTYESLWKHVWMPRLMTAHVAGGLGSPVDERCSWRSSAALRASVVLFCGFANT